MPVTACREAARQEIIRRYYAARCGQVQGRTEQAEVDRLKMIVQKAGLGPEDRPVIAAARKREEETAAPARPVIPRGEQKGRFTDDELALLAALGEESRSADQLVELTQIPTRRVLSALTMLQVDGAVEELPGKRFSALVELEQ